MMTNDVRNGELVVEIIDRGTVEIVRREEEKNVENKEPKGMVTLYAVMNG